MYSRYIVVILFPCSSGYDYGFKLLELLICFYFAVLSLLGFIQLVCGTFPCRLRL